MSLIRSILLCEDYWLIRIKTANDHQYIALLLFSHSFNIFPRKCRTVRRNQIPELQKWLCKFNFLHHRILTSHIFSALPSPMNHEESCVLDQSTICAEWYRLWSSFGFTEHQWSSRALKVEEYTRVRLVNHLSECSQL